MRGLPGYSEMAKYLILPCTMRVKEALETNIPDYMHERAEKLVQALTHGGVQAMMKK